ncbi:hypothetical protein [Leptothoe spongobia]|uniref:Uncharacterized protein n=1 Tax=Leptothoe spongobia TAU-MAC 1115 TaxID=1967444 RepID=A0A947DC51_9CYAN|nr:hypothetical protein [Leptothoe spongobia]MBT9314435.1 hypothetical protein [Leptothoe spongobia TAU-MAC 1115]
MVNKRFKIENLDNLEDLTSEELSLIQGGMTIAVAEPQAGPTEAKADSVELQAEELIAYPLPLPPQPIPYPLPIPCYHGGHRPYPKPKYIPCVCSPYPTKDGDLPWCAVIL